MNLEFKPAIERQDLLAPTVWEGIEKLGATEEIKVVEIDPEFALGLSQYPQFEIPTETEVNCLVVEGKRGEEKKYAALLVPYGKKANTNATVKRPLDVSKVGFAPLETVLEQTGMEFGGIGPIGLPESWSILVDSQILQQDNIIVGGGMAHSKLLVPTNLVSQIPNVSILEGLAKD